ncbi:MAG: GIY-YIG nuclease family protein [Bacteroidetes bacterium]|nr:GIY-YIG nuclease family protein [Bacteroidota bacterium]
MSPTKASQKCGAFRILYYVYIIYSQRAGKKYTGFSEDITLRLQQHNEGSLGVYTKNKGPWVLIHLEEFENKSEALKRERYLKTGAGRDYIKKVTGH